MPPQHRTLPYTVFIPLARLLILVTRLLPFHLKLLTALLATVQDIMHARLSTFLPMGNNAFRLRQWIESDSPSPHVHVVVLASLTAKAIVMLVLGHML